MTKEKSNRKRISLLAVSERERRIISEDLHEGLCQNLAAASIAVGLLNRQAENGKPLNIADLIQLTELINRTNAEARCYIRQLRPAAPEPEGLMKTLDQLAEATTQWIPCEFVCEKLIYARAPERALALYRISQEAVRNAVKHSQARQITITLRESQGIISTEICDNGCGFKPSAAVAGQGLAFMRKLAAAARATLEIRSQSGAGTAITCALPPNPELQG